MANEEMKDDVIFMKEEDDGSVVVGEAAPEQEQPAEEIAQEEAQDEAQDETLKAQDGDEEGHDEETSEEADARRERNRARRAQNKESRKNYIESLKRELAARDKIINDLSTRVASVEEQGRGSKMAQIDAAINEAANYYNHFKTVHQQAINEANGALATEATEKMFAAQQRHQMLQNAKKSMSQQQQRPQPLDPRLQKNAEDWMTKNQWYDPSGQDMDSDLVLKLDDRLVQEGWDPTTSEYWEELDARVKKYLPHRFNSSYNSVQQNGKAAQQRVPVSGSGNNTSGSSKGTYRLSAERVSAMKEAGMWDDPKARADMIRRYQEQDKAAANQSN